MALVDHAIHLSPLPIVNLDAITAPRDGIVIPASSECSRLFSKDNSCRLHYKRLAAAGVQNSIPIQCPHDFSSYAFRTPTMALALTGVIPFPRLGGDSERRMAKKSSVAKCPVEAFHNAERLLRSIEARLESVDRDAVRHHSFALHEIRKLNRTVKQTAERLCRDESSVDPDQANPDVVKIWKAAELMSTQFDVIEMLNNQDLVKLPPKSPVEVYRLFDKCVRIYRPSDRPGKITIHGQYGYTPVVLACDKTFHIIPTVLLENALKYSPEWSEISVEVSRSSRGCVVKVSNECLSEQLLTDRVFDRGVRLDTERDGSGNGLYLAKLIATQHKATIGVTCDWLTTGGFRAHFRLDIPEARNVIR